MEPHTSRVRDRGSVLPLVLVLTVALAAVVVAIAKYATRGKLKRVVNAIAGSAAAIMTASVQRRFSVVLTHQPAAASPHHGYQNAPPNRPRSELACS